MPAAAPIRRLCRAVLSFSLWRGGGAGARPNRPFELDPSDGAFENCNRLWALLD